MELGTLAPVYVIGSGPWNKDNPNFGTYVELADEPDARDGFRYSLGKDSTVEVPPVGTAVHLALEAFIRQEAAVSTRTGNAYIATKPKYRVAALKAA